MSGMSYNDIADLVPQQSAGSNAMSYNDIADLVPQAGQSTTDQIRNTLLGKNPNINQWQNQPAMEQGAKAALGVVAPITAGIGGAAALGSLGVGATAANVIGQPLGGAVYGAASNPQQPIQGAAEGAAYAALPSVLGGAANLAGKLTNFIAGSHLQDMSNVIDSANAGVQTAKSALDTNASSLFKTLSNAQSQTDLNNTNFLNVLKNGQANQVQSAANYKAVMDSAAAKGYSTIKNPATDVEQIPGVNKKMIVPQQSLNTIIDQTAQNAAQPSKILQAPNYEAPATTPGEDINASLLKNVSTPTKNMIARFNDTPSFANAHDLQSMLGSEASRLYNTGATADYDTANALTQARKSLLPDIINTFNKNGDTDLADAYQNASAFHKANVVPYQNVSQINNAMQGKPFTGNIVNLLAKNSVNNPNDLNDLATIRSHIMQNPDQANSFVAQALGKGITPTSNAASDFNVNSEKLLNNANNLPSNIKNMMTPDTQQKIGALQTAKNNIENQSTGIQSLSDQLKSATDQHNNIMKYLKYGRNIVGTGLVLKYHKEL